MQISERIGNIPWSRYQDAYGTCDSGTMISLFASLASSNRDDCESAIFGFWSNICHQGDVYSATTHALPFLIEIGVVNDTLLETDFLEFVADLATCAASTSDKTHRKWSRRISSSPTTYKLSVDELAQLDFDDVMALRNAFVVNAELLRQLIAKFEKQSPEFAGQLQRKIDRFSGTANAG